MIDRMSAELDSEIVDRKIVRRLKRRRVVGVDGKVRMIPVVEINSPDFAANFLAVFTHNVAKARRENKRVLGVADLDPTTA